LVAAKKALEKENNKISFEIEIGPKGANAVNVKLVSNLMSINFWLLLFFGNLHKKIFPHSFFARNGDYICPVLKENPPQ
jgi:hypothetical protein